MFTAAVLLCNAFVIMTAEGTQGPTVPTASNAVAGASDADIRSAVAVAAGMTSVSVLTSTPLTRASLPAMTIKESVVSSVARTLFSGLCSSITELDTEALHAILARRSL